MEQYINKSDLVVELEKRKKELETNILLAQERKDADASKTMHLYIGCYNSILSFLDTLKTKEVGSNIESEEDESIRKEIIAIIKSQKEQQCHIDGAVYDKMIDWLEKQGEQNVTNEEIEAASIIHSEIVRNQSCIDEDFIAGAQWLKRQNHICNKDDDEPQEPKFKIGDTMRTLQEAANGITDGLPVVVSIDDESYHCNNEIIYIKDQNDYEYPPMNRKQESKSHEAIEFPFKAKVKKNGKIVTIIAGQLDDQPKESCSYIAYSSDVTDGYKVYKTEDLEFIKQSKFKSGDWVVDKQGVVHQIANVVENVTNHTYGYDIVGGGYFNDDTEGVRLWTVINDARKGDILQAGKCTIIFDSLNKDLNGNTVVSSWYFSDSTKFHGMGPSQPDLWLIDGISPTTKEQRELLFAYMEDAGYEWDADKKEPKKIEQVEPKFHEGDWAVSDLDGKARQISEVHFDEYNSYYVVDGKSVNLEEYDRLHHSWTIEDIKDGDILAVEPVGDYKFPFVAIYKNRGLDFFNSYCFIGLDGKFYEGDTGHALDEIHPATKDQQELLFQRMKEAGWSWNAETKELIVVQKKYKHDFEWCKGCKWSMWIADAFEDPEEVYCTKKKIDIKRGDKIDCPYLK